MVLKRVLNFMALNGSFPYGVAMGKKKHGAWSLNFWVAWSGRTKTMAQHVTLYPSPLLLHRGPLLDRFTITTIEPIKLVCGCHFHHQREWTGHYSTIPILEKLSLGEGDDRAMLLQVWKGELSRSGCSLKHDKVTRCGVVCSQTMSHQQCILKSWYMVLSENKPHHPWLIIIFSILSRPFWSDCRMSPKRLDSPVDLSQQPREPSNLSFEPGEERRFHHVPRDVSV